MTRAVDFDARLRPLGPSRQHLHDAGERIGAIQSLAPPLTTSTRSMAAAGMRLQYTQPPNGSLSGVPSASTSARLAPDADSPRSPAPCVVGLDDLEVVRRNRLKPGVVFNASSNGAGGIEARSAAVRIAIGAAGDVRALSVRVAVTTTDSL